MTIAPTRRCEFCGYDLRGIASEQCPECGQAKTISLRFDDAEHYHRARAALEKAGLLVSFVNAGLASEIVYGSAKTAGWLRVSSMEYERVADLLQENGVRWIEESRVFVDRNQPACPNCGADLTGVSADTCLNCGVGLQWMDEPDAFDADEEVVCPHCMRQVKLVDGHCPECERRVNESETDQSDGAAPSSAAAGPPHQRLTVWFVLTFVFIIPVMIGVNLVRVMSNQTASFGGLSVAVAFAIASVLACLIVFRRKSKRKTS